MIIRPSSSARMVKCPGSLRMERDAPPRPESDDAKEGTAAHWLSEMVLTGQAPDTISLVDRFAPNGVCITAEMAEYCDVYINHIRSRGPGFAVETQVEYTVSPDITVKGTSDSGHIVDKTLYVDDLKYGYRLIDPNENWQLICYAIGLIAKLQPRPAVENIVMSIIQPRPYHPRGAVRSWTITCGQIEEYWVKLQQAAVTACGPDAAMSTGSHCQYCGAFAECPAAQAAGMNAVDVVMSGSNDVLSPNALSMELSNLARAKAVMDARIAGLEEVAKERIKQGTIVPGWGVQRQLGNTRWLKDADVTLIEMMAGVPLTEPKLITPAAAKRKGVGEEVIKAFTERPDNGFKLIPVDTDRNAKEIFGNG